jgi:DNA-binding MarR family transcriptional regulator
MDNGIDTIVLRLAGLADRLVLMEKNKILRLDSGLVLYPSEIHLLLLVKSGEAGNFPALVDKLGVTKGAVSQTITRLVSKGILEKDRRGSTNDLIIRFTPLGEQAALQCLRFRRALFGQMSEYLASLSREERDTITGFMTRIESVLCSIPKNP